MKPIAFITIFFLFVQNVKGQTKHIHDDSISVSLEEIKTASNKNIRLWNKDLYGPIIFINPQTREIFANETDTAATLKLNGNIYSGFLPDNINIANTALNWSGRRWAMIMLPVTQKKQNRINLLAHELFHTIQPSLGFTLNNVDNNQLDQKDGRIYLRLELEALKKAIESTSEATLREHLTNALTFRKYRHTIYKGSDSTENILELNEGIAEFTGVIVSDRNKAQAKAFFLNGIDDFFKNPTYVRSFAYYTTPVYGYLLYSKDKNWNKRITPKTNLTNYFVKKFNINILADVKRTVENIANNYNGKVIIKEETEREEKTKKVIADYKLKFINQPHLEIKFEKMNVSFDPRNIIPIEDKGTVYPNIRVTDLWGILTVENGALMGANWDKISISNPIKIEGKKVSGDGWLLELVDGYTIEKDKASGNYKLIKN